jgi:hypothetical protein
MKNRTAIWTIYIFLQCSGCICKKSVIDPNGLPRATQEGKNTFGFLLNGQPWTPKGVRGTANLSIDYDPGYNKGIFEIVAYDFTSPISEQLTIGVRDSLNFMTSPITISLNKESLYVISYSKLCDYFSTVNGVISSGSLTITSFNKTTRIIAGVFNATLYRPGCDTIHITDGRFDMRF